MKRIIRPLAAMLCLFFAQHAYCATIFSNNFSSGLTNAESVSGSWTVADGYLGEHNPTYQTNALDTYILQVDLRGILNPMLDFTLHFAGEGFPFDYLDIMQGSKVLSRFGFPNIDVSGQFGNLLASTNEPIAFVFRSDSSFVYSGMQLYSITISGTPSDVPEPASWAMLIGGFGLVGAGMRRRRVSVSFA